MLKQKRQYQQADRARLITPGSRVQIPNDVLITTRKRLSSRRIAYNLQNNSHKVRFTECCEHKQNQIYALDSTSSNLNEMSGIISSFSV